MTTGNATEELLMKDDVLELLSSARETADKVLGFLMAQSRARGGAVLALVASDLEVVASRKLAIERLRTATALWHPRSMELRAGKTVCQSADLLAPLGYEGADPLGAAFLAGVDHWDAVAFAAFRPALIQGLRVTQDQRTERLWAQYLTAMSSEELMRAQLVAMLERHEWNIAEVSRAMGVTRRTVYLRLARFRIPLERERAPKASKPQRRPVNPLRPGRYELRRRARGPHGEAGPGDGASRPDLARRLPRVLALHALPGGRADREHSRDDLAGAVSIPASSGR